MADVEAGLTVGQYSLNALLELTSETQSMHQTLKKLLKAQNDYQQRGPTFVNLNGSGVADANGDTLVFDLGGPSYGHTFEVRQLIVGGATWATTALGNAVMVVGSSSPGNSVGGGVDVSLAGVQDHAASLPSVAFYSAGQFVIRHPNHLYCVILSPTALQLYQIAGDAFNVPDGPTSTVFTG